MENKIRIVGFLDNERVKTMHTTPISNARRLMDGYKLDELQISTTLKTMKDFDELIELLQIHKYCFSKPEKDPPAI